MFGSLVEWFCCSSSLMPVHQILLISYRQHLIRWVAASYIRQIVLADIIREMVKMHRYKMKLKFGSSVYIR